MTKNDAIRILSIALLQVQENDVYLLNNGVKEEAINHQLVGYIQSIAGEMGLDDYNVDLEYNIDGEGKKKVYIKGRRYKIRPDALIHQRGHNEGNLLAIEVKKQSPSQHDKNKIVQLLSGKYNYKFGALISYYPQKQYFQLILYNNHGGVIRSEIYYIVKPELV